MKWGIPREGRPVQINMRVETAGPTIHKQRRCLIVVDGFYEWRPATTPAARQQFVLRDRDGPRALEWRDQVFVWRDLRLALGGAPDIRG